MEYWRNNLLAIKDTLEYRASLLNFPRHVIDVILQYQLTWSSIEVFYDILSISYSDILSCRESKYY